MRFILGDAIHETVDHYVEPSPYLKKTLTVRQHNGVCEITETTWFRGYDSPFASVTTFHETGGAQ
jgi:hypothetical protein